MQRIAILVLLSVPLVSLVTPSSHSASDAPKFVSLEGGFSISLPERYKQLTPLSIRMPSANAHVLQTTEIFCGVVFSNTKGTRRRGCSTQRNGPLTQRNLYVLDDKGNEIERTVFAADGKVRSKVSFTYEFDSNGHWTRQTPSWSVVDERLRPFEPTTIIRTITYY